MILQRLILTFKREEIVMLALYRTDGEAGPNTKASEGNLVDVTHTEAAQSDLVRMIERRSRNGEVDPDELEPFYMESVRRYNARREGKMRAVWRGHHQGQAARLKAVLEELIARHEEQAERYRD